MKQVRPLDPVSEDQIVSPEETTFGDILSEFEQSQQAADEEHTTGEGTVVGITGDNIIVDIGRKIEGVVPRESLPDVQVGDKLLVNITGRDEEGYYRLSTIRVERPKDWSGLEAAFAEKRTIAGQVVQPVKGGLRVDVGVPAFMPASRSGARDVPEMEKLVGTEIQCRIIKLDTAKDDVVVDRRVVLEEEEKRAKAERFGSFQEGQVVTGMVRSLTDFGAFIDLGGVDGLLHVTDIAWYRVGKPADVLQVSEEVEVKILKINPDTKKISLGRKQLLPDPWSQAAEKYQVGQRVQGKVVRTTDFGAFVELEPGLEGLIHVSEMSWTKKIRKPSDVVQPGEQVEVAVLGVNPAEKRISLGLKQALGDPWQDAKNTFPVGSVVEGTVINLTKFGAFVDLGNGFEGMIHIADITREKRLDHPREVLATGQPIRAQVLDVDVEKRRIRLGMKQLEPTSLDHYLAEHQAGETVSGRVLEVSSTKARVELGEGVVANCRLAVAAETNERQQSNAPATDVTALSQMLAARWKSGGGEKENNQRSKDHIRPGQIRSFRIVSVSPEQKKIELELAS